MNRLYNPRLQAVSGKVTLWTYLKRVKCELKTSRCYNSEIFTIRLIILELFWDVPKYYWLSFLLTPESELTFLLRVLKIICKDIPTERTGNCFLSFGKSLFCVFLSLNVLRVCVSFNRNAIPSVPWNDDVWRWNADVAWSDNLHTPDRAMKTKAWRVNSKRAP